MQFANRDNGRTPMQWDTSLNAGFSTGESWIAVNKNYTTLNVASQEKDGNSCLNYFKKLVQLRKNNPAFIYGKYTLLDAPNTKVYAYTREWRGERFLVLLNFTKDTARVKGIQISKAKPVLGNYAKTPSKSNLSHIILRPYESIIYKL
jgi:oligo-1,6-glucosidase